MITRYLTSLAFILLAGGAHANQTLTFAYLGWHDDPHYQENRAYTGLILRDNHRPIDGVNVAIKESKIIGRAAGFTFELDEHILDQSGLIIDHARNTSADILLLDLPADHVVQIADAIDGETAPLIVNIRAADNPLRDICNPNLFHTVASRSMLHDALAQYLNKMRWYQVLILEGEEPDDRIEADSFAYSAEKFGLRITGRKTVTLSNDPRKRDAHNLALLTGEHDYEVIFIADQIGEFGRYVPYSSVLPRPVVGSEGLKPTGWHWSWERHGAPQLNQRFDRKAKRNMTQQDWAGWMAVKSVVEAVIRTGSIDRQTIGRFLRSDDVRLDSYKGVPSSFRSWNGQLRQPVLLATNNAVIARAPIDGFLHPVNNLDTLGTPEQLAACQPE